MGLDRKLKKLVIVALALIVIAGAVTATVFIIKSTKKPKHTHVFDQKIESIEFAKDFAGCESYATYYYACKCSDEYYESAKTHLNENGKLPGGGNGWFTGESESSKPTGHTKIGGEVVTNATCTTDGKLSKVTCGVCNKVLDEEKIIPAFGHTWNDVYNYENGEHWISCKNIGCTATKERAACSGGTATCKEAAVCAICNNKYGNKNAANHVADTYKYESNEDGTHKKIHTCCDAVENEAETCEFGGFVGGTNEHHKTCAKCSYQTEKGAHVFTETGCTVCGRKKYIFAKHTVGENKGYVFFELNDKSATYVVIDSDKIDETPEEGYEKKIIAIDDEYAFKGCDNLTKIYYKGTKEEWQALEGAATAVPQGATVYYYSDVYVENQDTWHYADGEPTVNEQPAAHVHDFSKVTQKTCSVCGEYLYEIEEVDDKVTLTKCNAVNSTEILINNNMASKPTAPVMLKAIAADAFAECTKLEKIFFHGTEEEWNALGGNSVVLPDGAKVYFYNDSVESGSGNRWNYVNGVPTVNENTVGKT